MEYEVLRDFFDKNTKEFYPLGSYYETKNKKRAEELHSLGFLKIEILEQEKPKVKRSKKPN